MDKKALKQWFGQQVETHMAALYSTALRLTDKSADAEDLVAEAVIKAWTSIDTLHDRRRFRSWIFCIQRNLFISNYRKKSVRPKESSYDEHPAECDGNEIASLLIQQPNEFLNWWANPEQELVNNLLGEEIMQAIERLPEVYQEAVLMVNLQGFSYDEAAEVLGVSPGTIRSRMNRGRTLLQKMLWLHACEAGLVKDDSPAEGTT